MFFLYFVVFSKGVKLSTQKWGVFNINIVDGDQKLITTYRDNGYACTIKINNAKTKELSKSVQTYQKVEVAVSYEVSESQKQINVIHTITNRNADVVTVDLADHCDSKIGEDDRPTLSLLPDGNGLMTSSGPYTLYTYLNRIMPKASTVWIGKFSKRYDNLWTSGDVTSITDLDTGMAYSWKNIRIEPSESATVTAVYSCESLPDIPAATGVPPATPVPPPTASIPLPTVSPTPYAFKCGECPICHNCPECPECPDCPPCPPFPKCPDCEAILNCPTPCPVCPSCPHCQEINDDLDEFDVSDKEHNKENNDDDVLMNYFDLMNRFDDEEDDIFFIPINDKK